jgi:stage II sporulation protein D
MLQPDIRVGLVVGSASLSLGGVAALTVAEPDGMPVAQVPAGAVWRVVPSGSGLSLAAPGGLETPPAEQLTVASPDPGGFVRINGREYRGELTLLRDGSGVTAVNRVGLETYLGSVVSSEMGRRATAEAEAVRAQAVISRTYALRNMGRWRTLGFDLYATVADQVYGGLASETPLGSVAVADTRGVVLTDGGELIDAFFYSTCGGRTAGGTEIFRNASRSYLRSVSDLGPDGVAYCSISPRYHWREEWTAEQLRTVLQRTLPDVARIPRADVRSVSDVRISGRTGSGRVGSLAIGLGGRDAQVDGPSVRSVLRPASGDLLRSNAFSLVATRAGGRITRLVAEGSGAGHAVGLCQWGAVGRARAGQRHAEILAAYYPGTQLMRYY